MSLEDLGLEDYEHVSRDLGIDGDIIIFQACCVFNEDDDQSRRLIQKQINSKIERFMREAECDRYILFLTTKFNFRDDLVDDYKANRNDLDRPVNLAWAKRWATENLNAFFVKKMEADDLLGIFLTENPNAVLWSLDKDLRQIPGNHLDDATMKVITITKAGKLEDRGKKVYFDGTIGFYFQLLIGDSTDHIIGCGKRQEQVYKSGAKKGETYMKRVGVGPKAAIKVLKAAMDRAKGNVLQECLRAVGEEYKKVHGKGWLKELETQAQLLWMIREQDGDSIKMWTYDGRDEWFDLKEGVFINDSAT